MVCRQKPQWCRYHFRYIFHALLNLCCLFSHIHSKPTCKYAVEFSIFYIIFFFFFFYFKLFSFNLHCTWSCEDIFLFICEIFTFSWTIERKYLYFIFLFKEILLYFNVFFYLQTSSIFCSKIRKVEKPTFYICDSLTCRFFSF